MADMQGGDLARQRAIAALRSARQGIIRLAARWQASRAVDTTALNQPLFDIQDALAALESPPQGSTPHAAAPAHPPQSLLSPDTASAAA